MANSGENPFPLDEVLRESLESFRAFELTDEASAHIDRAVLGAIHGVTPSEEHANYDGQPRNGTISPVMDYELARPDLIFTDLDRLQANRAVKAGQASPALIDRLTAQADQGRSTQAAYFLSVLGIEL